MFSINGINQIPVFMGTKDENKDYKDGEIVLDESDNSMYVYSNNIWARIGTPFITEPDEIEPELPDHIQAQIRLLYPEYDIFLRRRF